jgi:tRNA G46 methylase TrmB
MLQIVFISLYASILKTKTCFHFRTNTQTYVNLSYSKNSTGQESTERSDTAEYTTLDNRSRDDNKTYDNINAVQ